MCELPALSTITAVFAGAPPPRGARRIRQACGLLPNCLRPEAGSLEGPEKLPQNPE